MHATLELVGNNLANHNAIELAAGTDQVNATLRGKAHQIDGPLYQYWLTVTPAADAELSALSSSAYILLPGVVADNDEAPDPRPEASPADATTPEKPAPMRVSVSIPNAGQDAFLGPLSIGRPASLADCDNSRSDAPFYTPTRRACSLLQAKPQSDAIIFFLEHQARHGLVRLGGTECRERTVARIASSGQSLRFPIPPTRAGNGSKETYEWLVEPEIDTYYAVALTDARAARGLANHIDELPLRCSEVMRPGLQGAALQQWLDEFALLAAHSSQHFDWRGLQVKDVL